MEIDGIEISERTNRLYKKDKNFDSLIAEANSIFLDNFKNETNFERAVFFSWYCSIADCRFCYMSAQPEKVKLRLKIARRSMASLIAETILVRKLGWDFGFFSGGHNAYAAEDFLELVKNVSKTIRDRIWINIGYVSEENLRLYLPYVKGVVASVETLNQRIHDFACPSKPVMPFEKMFEYAERLGLKKAITIILGLGETIDDFSALEEFIDKHKIDKIHFYALNAQKGTYYENAKPIAKEYHAEWIARTRIRFPKIDIQLGTWTDKTGNISLLLKAGANSISKFPAIRKFATKEARAIEEEAKRAGRRFKGSLTEFNGFDIDNDIKALGFNASFSSEIRKKLDAYVSRIRKNIKKYG